MTHVILNIHMYLYVCEFTQLPGTEFWLKPLIHWGQEPRGLVSHTELISSSRDIVHCWYTYTYAVCVHYYLITVLSEPIRSRLWRQQPGGNSHICTTFTHGHQGRCREFSTSLSVETTPSIPQQWPQRMFLHEQKLIISGIFLFLRKLGSLNRTKLNNFKENVYLFYPFT